MRYHTDHKERTRKRIVAEAAKAIRADGPHRVGVAGVMARADLTHGGFYAHFSSKDDLVVAALAEMSDAVLNSFLRVTAGKDAAAALRSYIDFYLSPAHRDARESGCPLPSLAADLPRLDNDEAHDWFSRCVTRLTAAVAGPVAALGYDEPQAVAASIVAEMVGALSIARGIGDGRLSGTILKRSRLALKARLGLDDD